MKEVLLVGNPNSGKTTLYNSLTFSNEHIGNWHGVTVEEKKKEFSVGKENFVLVDTPGIYSLCPLSFEEEVSVDIIEKDKCKIINLCDQNNLQRNLYLTLCLLEEENDIIIAINQIDKKVKFKVDELKLSKLLGAPVVLINAEKKSSLEGLKKELLLNFKPKFMPKYLDTIDFSCVEPFFFEQKNKQLFCLKAFEKNKKFFLNHNFSEEEINKIFSAVPKDSVVQISSKRYEFIDEIIENSCAKEDFVYGESKFDKVLLNKFLAFPCFLLILSVIFYLTFFSFGAFLSDALSSLLNFITNPLVNLLANSLGQGWIYALFSEAIFGGLATVLSFLPQVVLLFFFLSLLEDSGYLSRVAFIFEDILSKVGLSGKSVYTLLMGFGCSTTAIMTARNMDNKNSKIKTALLCPYMSCSAKIPIYTVIGGAFFGAKNIFCIIGLYLLGVVVAIAISKILDMTVLKSTDQTFILEFPPYRRTSLIRVGKILWKNVKVFLIKVGSVMISMNIIIFLLSSFDFRLHYVLNGDGVSMLQRFGQFLAPLFAPLGFNNWAIVSALLAGLVAKEVVVSSIAMFNGIDSSASKLISQSIMLSSSVVYFASTASVLSFLVFCLLYTPCIASISMMVQEIGKKWTFFAVILQLTVAYVLSFVVYNISFAMEVFGFWKVFFVAIALIIIFFAFLFIIKHIRRKKCPHCCDSCHGCKK